MSGEDSDMARPPPYIGVALGISSQEWSEMGLGSDPSVAATTDLDTTVERITALLLIRLIAWIQPRGTFPDLSTTTVCRQLLVRPESWPASITVEIMDQLKNYVKVILSGYNDNPYHNFEHCYHVTVSANKLMDMILNTSSGDGRVCTYGYRDDALMQFVQIFAALIHDVEHRGIPNRQLAVEDDELALLYNDQSIAEMRSLTIGFSELKKEDYNALRQVVFPQLKDYHRFRAATVDLVLTTDLASPERTQLGKSKWKEAFGDDYETVERKVLKQMERRASMMSRRSSNLPSRRMSAQSIMSELTLESPAAMLDIGTLEDDESLSGTPDSSDNEDDNIGSGAAIQNNKTGPLFRKPKTSGTDDRMQITSRTKSPEALLQRQYQSSHARALRKKVGDYGVDAASVTSDATGHINGMALKFHRRLSSIGPASTGPTSKKTRNARLGLLRTVDLSGESIEAYQSQSARPSATGAYTENVSEEAVPGEEIDQLREMVVMETIMKAADVAHNLQGWEQMARWSNRLFLELKRAFVLGRGDDPQSGWFNNQIGFLEAYLLPLARKLDDTGVFGDTRGAVFAQIVEENKERWMREGASLTANIIREGHLQFPEADSDDDIGL